MDLGPAHGACCLLIACERGSSGSIGSKGVGAAHKNIEAPRSFEYYGIHKRWEPFEPFEPSEPV